MATPQLKTSQIHDEIAAFERDKVDDFSFKRIKREIDAVRKHNNVIACDLMAMLYYYRGDYASAIEQHEAAIRQDPHLSLLYSNYGITLRTDKKPVQAQQQLLKALTLTLQPEGNELITTLANLVVVSIDIYDLDTLYKVTKDYAETIEKYAMSAIPTSSWQKLSELQSLAEKANISESALTQACSQVTNFLKQNHLEPVQSCALADPEGGLYFNYYLPVNVDELLAIEENYIDFLIENHIRNIDISASFHCA